MSLNATDADTAGLDVSGVFAPLFWGFFVSLYLGGITVVQAYIYFPHPKDRLLVQLMAGTMLVLDLASSALVAQSLYHYLIPHFGSLDTLQSFTPELSADCVLTTIITFISQLYFAHQIYTFKHGGIVVRTVIGIIIICAVLAFIGGLACTSTMYIHQHGILSNRSWIFSIFFGLAKGFGALTDILATITMCTLLFASKTGISRTNGIIKSLIQFIIERGALVTLIQTLLLITFYAAPTKLLWLAFHVNVTKLYANTFFAMLNARDHIKRQNERSIVITAGDADSLRFQSRTGTFTVGSLEAQETNDNAHKSYPMGTRAVTRAVVITDV